MKAPLLTALVLVVGTPFLTADAAEPQDLILPRRSAAQYPFAPNVHYLNPAGPAEESEEADEPLSPRGYSPNRVPRTTVSVKPVKVKLIEPSGPVGPKLPPVSQFSGPLYNDSDPLLPYQQAQAEKGNPQAQYAMAIRYLTGNGVDQDIEYALEWLGKASSAGYLKARAKLKEVRKTQIASR